MMSSCTCSRSLRTRDAKRNMSGTFNWPLSGMVELSNRYAGEAGPEVQVADSSDPEGMAPTAAHLNN